MRNVGMHVRSRHLKKRHLMVRQPSWMLSSEKIATHVDVLKPPMEGKAGVSSLFPVRSNTDAAQRDGERQVIIKAELCPWRGPRMKPHMDTLRHWASPFLWRPDRLPCWFISASHWSFPGPKYLMGNKNRYLTSTDKAWIFHQRWERTCCSYQLKYQFWATALTG